MADEKDDRRRVMHFQLGFMSEQNGHKRKTNLKIDPEDIIAVGAVLIALIFAIAMVSGSVPINKYTVGIVGFSGGGAIIAGIVKARRGKATRTPWIEWALIAFLVVAFGVYVAVSWGWVATAFR
jgi:hypothetical protein